MYYQVIGTRPIGTDPEAFAAVKQQRVGVGFLITGQVRQTKTGPCPRTVQCGDDQGGGNFVVVTQTGRRLPIGLERQCVCRVGDDLETLDDIAARPVEQVQDTPRQGIGIVSGKRPAVCQFVGLRTSLRRAYECSHRDGAIHQHDAVANDLYVKRPGVGKR